MRWGLIINIKIYKMGYFKEKLHEKIVDKRLTYRADLGKSSFNYNASVSQIRRALNRTMYSREDWMKENLLEFLPKIKVLKNPKVNTGYILMMQDLISFFDVIPMKIAMFLDSKIPTDYFILKVSIARKLAGKLPRDSFFEKLIESYKEEKNLDIHLSIFDCQTYLCTAACNDENEKLGKFLFDEISKRGINEISAKLAFKFNWVTDRIRYYIVSLRASVFESLLFMDENPRRLNHDIEGYISTRSKEHMNIYINWLKSTNPDYEKK